MSLATELVEGLVSLGATGEMIALALRVLEKAEAVDEARRASKREGNRERQRRHRNALVTRDRALHNAVTSPDKEIPPTPPKEINPSLSEVSNETSLVPEVSGTRDVRKKNVELFQTVVGMWNDMAAGSRLVSCRDITPPRQSAILARTRDFSATYDFENPLDGWRKIMGLVRASPFLCGETNGFRCDFDFLVRAKSFTKIMEGKYEARAAKKYRF